ncbi:pentapeptide repeat-containing protein [Porticoccus sp. W117]|uniref:pentapeptide repeat-containing protein n=1 Tax=Porticoccus sp. W117 TaxID=3054777 RepID=UPI0025998393|nr:pentapeptide repeat-containing protein [Porticoccus sp. W117]MDM3872038.1 pentapeptide repeat-containing protein [Porticoccus sp. W117]
MQKNDEERLDILETRLIEQDHRLLHVLNNFFIQRRDWPKGDPRRTAAFKALLHRLFFSPSTVATAGSLIAVASLIVLFQQNAILFDQNQLISDQNHFFQEQISKQSAQLEIQKQQIEDQNEQWISQRRSQLLDILYEDGPDGNLAKNIRAKSEAVNAFIKLERRNDPDTKVDLSQINLIGANLTNMDLSNVDLSHAKIQNANLRGTNFAHSTLEKASLEGSNLWSSNFNDASLRGADLSNTKHIGLTNRWKNTNIYGVIGLTKQNLVWVKRRGAVEIGYRPMPPSMFEIR